MTFLKNKIILLEAKAKDSKEIKPVNPKGNHPWIFTGRNDTEAEASILWPLDEKNWLLGKAPNAGKDWRQREKGMTEDEMVGWHHQLNEHEFEQAPGVSDGQGSLACCSPWGLNKLDMTEQLNWTDVKHLANSLAHGCPINVDIQWILSGGH